MTTLEPLRQHLATIPGMKLAIVFGSVATGRARAGSDVDLAILLDRPMDAATKMGLIGDVAEITGRPVDLIDLRRAGEPLLGEVLKGVRLVGSDAEFAELALRHIYANEDYVPYMRRALAERRRAWIG